MRLNMNGERIEIPALTVGNADRFVWRYASNASRFLLISSKLLSVGTFFRLPWVSWDAPKVLRTDMGAFSLLSLFAASEVGGSAPVNVLKPSGVTTLPDGESALTVSRARVRAAVAKLMNG